MRTFCLVCIACSWPSPIPVVAQDVAPTRSSEETTAPAETSVCIDLVEAQRDDSGDREEGRRLFELGLGRMQAGDFASARASLTQALERCGRVSTAYNLALVLGELGEWVEAAYYAHEALSGRWGEVDLDKGQRLRVFLANAYPWVARLLVSENDVQGLRVDGTPALVLSTRSDGEATVLVPRGRRRLSSLTREVVVDARVGEAQRVRWAGVETASVTTEPEATLSDTERTTGSHRRVRRRRIVLSALGIVVVAAIAGAVGTIVYRKRNDFVLVDNL